MKKQKKQKKSNVKNTKNTKEVVINVCFGGFSLSPEASLWCYEHGMKGLAEPALKYFSGDTRLLQGDLDKWHEYLKTGQNVFFLTFFTPDEKFVLASHIGRKNRDNPILVQCVKELGEKSWGTCAELKVVEIPVDVEWDIEEYDGWESIAENHRTWG